MTRYNHELKISFATPCDGLTPYEGKIWYNAVVHDDVVRVTPTGISFEFTRAKRMKPDRWMDNRCRAYELERSLMYVLGNVGYAPEISGCNLLVKGAAVGDGPLAPELSRLIRTHLADDASSTMPADVDLSCLFEGGALGNTVYTCLSFLYASRAKAPANERFRLLWSGFNTLYRYAYARDQKVSSGREFEQLAHVCEIIQGTCPMQHSLLVYRRHRDQILGGINLFAYASRRLQDGKRQQRLKRMDGALLDRMKCLKRRSSETFLVDRESMRWAYSCTPRQDDRVEIGFLVCEYLYALRNRYFHGVASYPLFFDKPDPLLDALCDLLEASVLDLLDYLISLPLAD